MTGSSTVLELIAGTVDANPVEIGPTDVPCEVDYSTGALPDVPPEQTVYVPIE